MYVIKEMEQKKKIGIVGESGSGKTTLLKKIFENGIDLLGFSAPEKM